MTDFWDPPTAPSTVLRFESGTAAERVSLVLEELERLVLRCAQQAEHADGAGGSGAGVGGPSGAGEEAADVLDRTSFQQELGALLPLLLAYTPRRLGLPQVTEALLCHAKLAPAHLLVRAPRKNTHALPASFFPPSFRVFSA